MNIKVISISAAMNMYSKKPPEKQQKAEKKGKDEKTFEEVMKSYLK